MKKILVTRKLIKDSEDKALKIFDAKLNSNDELYSQSRVIEMSQGCDGVLTSLTDKMDKDTINKLPDTIKIISNFAVGFGNIDLEAAKKRGIAVTNTPEVLSDATAEIGVLLILGAYQFILEKLNSVFITGSDSYIYILYFILGAVLGILAFSRVIKWLLTNYENKTMIIMIGLILGSVFNILPLASVNESIFLETLNFFTSEFSIIICTIAGFFIILFLEKISEKNEV